MFHFRRDFTLRFIEAHLSAATTDLPKTVDNISALIQLSAKITSQLGEYSELFLAFEQAFKDSAQIFSIQAAIEKGKADKSNNIKHKEGFRSFLFNTLTSQDASKKQANTQDLYCQVSNRLEDRELLSEFTSIYRGLISVDNHIEVFYKTGYYMDEKAIKR